jgi:hypothetical protein
MTALSGACIESLTPPDPDILMKWCREGGGKEKGVAGREKGYSITGLLEMVLKSWEDQATQGLGCCRCDVDILRLRDEGQGFGVW